MELIFSSIVIVVRIKGLAYFCALQAEKSRLIVFRIGDTDVFRSEPFVQEGIGTQLHVGGDFVVHPVIDEHDGCGFVQHANHLEYGSGQEGERQDDVRNTAVDKCAVEESGLVVNHDEIEQQQGTESGTSCRFAVTQDIGPQNSKTFFPIDLLEAVQ